MKIIPSRRILCKECKKLKHAKKYQWRVKDGVTTLDSKTCLTCKSENVKALRKLKVKHPQPKNSKCQCCGKKTKLHCDHSHNKSKRFRGWLCSKCNVGIGNLGDTIVGLKRALKYLSK
jgi:hypothetical protein